MLNSYLTRVSRKEIFGSQEENCDLAADDSHLLNEELIPNFIVKETEVGSLAEETISEDNEEIEQDNLAFPLFGSVVNVTIEEQEPVTEPKHRPDSYYFFKPSDALRQQFIESAIPGEEIINSATIPLPGMKLSWKVIDFNVEVAQAKKENRKRTRPGKKARARRREIPRRKSVPGERQYGESRCYGSMKLRIEKKMGFKSRWSRKNH